MSGAGTVSPDETTAAAINPACASMVEEDWEKGLNMFFPRKSYSAGVGQVN
ncbi:MAG: hypothetical protein VCA13_03230 [PS1 clade bacterium]|tara:strand:- start:351 stop:503 length:153 start_codon:yes stop_codon:yes gene_type:complete